MSIHIHKLLRKMESYAPHIFSILLQELKQEGLPAFQCHGCIKTQIFSLDSYFYCLVLWASFCKDKWEERLGLPIKKQCLQATSGQSKSKHLDLAQANQPLKVILQLPPSSFCNFSLLTQHFKAPSVASSHSSRTLNGMLSVHLLSSPRASISPGSVSLLPLVN